MNKQLLKDISASLNLGTEGAEVDMTEENPAILEGETSAANTIEDIAEDEAASDLIENMDEGLDDEESVEELVAVVESAQASGKALTRVEAAALTITFAQITKKHFKDPIAQLPAREANEDMSLANLNLACESLKESASNIFKSVMDQIKKIIETVKDFLSRHLNKYTWLQKRGSKIYATINSLTDIVPGSTVVDAKVLGIDGDLSLETIARYSGSMVNIDNASTGVHIGHLFGEVNAVDSSAESGAHTKIFSDINTESERRFNEISEGFKVRGPGAKEVPENIKKWFGVPGNHYFGLKDLGKGLLVCSLGKTNVEFDADAAKTNLEFPNKDVAAKMAKDITGIARILGVGTSKHMRDWTKIRLGDSIQKRSGNVDTRHNTKEKENAKLVVAYTKEVAGLAITASKINFDFCKAVLDFLDAAMTNKEIEGEATEAKA